MSCALRSAVMRHGRRRGDASAREARAELRELRRQALRPRDPAAKVTRVCESSEARLAALRPLVLIPTYNERENVAAIVAATLAALPVARVLVNDDASPDGTGALADELACAESRVSVLHRAGKQGLGRAYLDGFRWGLAAPWRPTHLITMDANFSHDPKYLAGLCAACQAGADVAIGSRYVSGGGTVDWGVGRNLISRAGGLYARTLLGVPVRDMTAGFVCYARAVIADLDPTAVAASGYGFQIEMKHRAHRRGFVLRELPIVFPDRTRGASKMTPGIAAEALRLVWRLRFAA